MNIVYFLESTDLCGGVKVVFNHVDYLVKRGHFAAVVSPDQYPPWFNKCVMFHQVTVDNLFNLPFFKDIDVIVGTNPFHILPLYKTLFYSNKLDNYVKNPSQNFPKKLVHFIQGYEIDCTEAKPFINIITQVYSLNIPKITISERLSKRLLTIYPDKVFMTCGQGLESDIFFMKQNVYVNTNSIDSNCDNSIDSVVLPKDNKYSYSSNINSDSYDTVVLIGAFTISVKRIADGLLAFKKASERNSSLKLVRISAVDTKLQEESLIGKIDEYYINLTPFEVGELLRKKNGVLISPSSEGEGFGLPALEAMACGVPTILTDIPSYRAFSKTDDYTFFVPVGNIDKMAESICKILDSGNKNFKQHLIKRGIEVAKQYSYPQVAENMEKCLLNVINH